jgi:hypothetical protein
VALVDFGGGPSFGAKIIVLIPLTKLIVYTYVAREIVLHIQITHSYQIIGLKPFAKKLVASN